MGADAKGRLVCASCGSVYPLASVTGLAAFDCSICGATIVVPSSTPASPPPRAHPAAVPPELPSSRAPPANSARTAAAQEAARSARGKRVAHRTAPRRTVRQGPSEAIVISAVVGILGLGVGVFAVLNDDAPRTPTTPTAAETHEPTPAAAPTGADPRLDAATWRSLSARERAELRRETLDAVDRRNPAQLEWAASFFEARGETEAQATVARWAAEADPEARWAREVLGLRDCGELLDELLEQSPRAEELRTDAVRELEELAEQERPRQGPWFPPVDTVERIDELARQVRTDERALENDYNFGVARWVKYQRTVEVMRDYPALHATVGPYVVFVQVGGSPKTDLSDADEVELGRAKRVLRETTELYGSLYDGWHRDLGALFGMRRYGPENATFETLLKVNAFSREDDFERFCRERHAWSPGAAGVRAFYSTEEPRFILTHDGDRNGESPYATYQTQCHEGVHQLAHFYTRELTEKKTGKRPSWRECRVRPLWSSEGFAEFFSAFAGDGDDRVWMQPHDANMELIWVLSQAFEKLEWDDFPIERLTLVASGAELDEAIVRTAPALSAKRGEDERWQAWHARIRDVYANLYYARAWSLVYYLWNAHEGGAPKYRSRYVQYLKREFVVPERGDSLAKNGRWTNKLLLDALGIQSMDQLRVFERDWREWIDDLCARHKRSEWLRKKEILFRLTGADR